MLLALGAFVLALCGCGGNGPIYNPTPQISGMTPPEITAGSQSFTMFVSGTQFVSTTTVQWNGADLPTSYNQQSGELLTVVPAADVQSAGVAQVTVTSPAPGGGRSLAVAFTINSANNGGPTITSLSPGSAGLNGAAFTLTVNGTNFASGDYVTWDSGLRTTTFGSATQLTAQILATDLTQAQVASVAVHTSQLGVASPSVSFQVGSSKSGNVKFPQIISASAAGGPANGLSSSPSVNADGRYVAFYSKAKNLVSGGAAGNIFVRDTCAGQPASCVQSTTPVDLAANGTAPNGPAAAPVAISADGRYVAFTSSATNLTPDSPAGAARSRVFVFDVCAGSTASASCLPRTDLVSVDANGRVIGGSQPSISAGGRFVAFTAPVSSTASAVMVRDTCLDAGASCTPQTLVASLDGTADIAVDPSASSAISGSGRYVAFVRAKSGTTPSQIFVRDTCLGVSGSCVPSTARVSASTDGQQANADSDSPSISSDGRFVVFESTASNLADGAPGGGQIYLRDTCAGPTAPFGCAPSTTEVSANALLSGETSGSYAPSISPSGRYISYIVHAQNENAAPGSTTTGYIVVYDTCFGATGACSPHASELSATDSSGNEIPLTGDIRVAAPVTDGGFVAFFTQSLPALRTSGLGDVFLTTTPFRQ
jgi:Tol biopolymer transport system component